MDFKYVNWIVSINRFNISINNKHMATIKISLNMHVAMLSKVGV